jgi:hypothetical protein
MTGTHVGRMVHRWYGWTNAWTVTGASSCPPECSWQGMQGAECLFALPWVAFVFLEATACQQ